MNINNDKIYIPIINKYKFHYVSWNDVYDTNNHINFENNYILCNKKSSLINIVKLVLFNVKNKKLKKKGNIKISFSVYKNNLHDKYVIERFLNKKYIILKKNNKITEYESEEIFYDMLSKIVRSEILYDIISYINHVLRKNNSNILNITINKNKLKLKMDNLNMLNINNLKLKNNTINKKNILKKDIMNTSNMKYTLINDAKLNNEFNNLTINNLDKILINLSKNKTEIESNLNKIGVEKNECEKNMKKLKDDINKIKIFDNNENIIEKVNYDKIEIISKDKYNEIKNKFNVSKPYDRKTKYTYDDLLKEKQNIKYTIVKLKDKIKNIKNNKSSLNKLEKDKLEQENANLSKSNNLLKKKIQYIKSLMIMKPALFQNIKYKNLEYKYKKQGLNNTLDMYSKINQIKKRKKIYNNKLSQKIENLNEICNNFRNNNNCPACKYNKQKHSDIIRYMNSITDEYDIKINFKINEMNTLIKYWCYQYDIEIKNIENVIHKNNEKIKKNNSHLKDEKIEEYEKHIDILHDISICERKKEIRCMKYYEYLTIMNEIKINIKKHKNIVNEYTKFKNLIEKIDKKIDYITNLIIKKNKEKQDKINEINNEIINSMNKRINIIDKSIKDNNNFLEKYKLELLDLNNIIKKYDETKIKNYKNEMCNMLNNNFDIEFAKYFEYEILFYVENDEIKYKYKNNNNNKTISKLDIFKLELLLKNYGNILPSIIFVNKEISKNELVNFLKLVAKDKKINYKFYKKNKKKNMTNKQIIE